MIKNNSLILKAVLVLLAGTAFFSVGCLPKAPVTPVAPSPEEVQKDRLSDLYSDAERAFQSKDYENALYIYNLYLAQDPKGERARNVIYRIATIKYERGLYDHALYYYKKLIVEYPGHPDYPLVKYDIIKTYYALGDYDNACSEAFEWLKENTGHPLEGDIFLLLGRIYNNTMDKSTAFSWLLKALNNPYTRVNVKKEIDSEILALIGKCSITMLEDMLDNGENNQYIPNIYQRLTILFLDAQDLDNAKKTAMNLVRSTRDQYWVDIGRELLERIEDDISPRRGRIGCLLPLSGPFAIYGQEALNGIQLGMGLFNDTTDDWQLELVIRDTGGTIEGAVSGVEELANEERVMAIIGPLASKTAIAAAEKAQELRIPIITLTQRDEITAQGDMVFRNFLTPTSEVKTLLDETMDKMNMKRFAIFYPDNAYGRFYMNLFWDQVDKMGGSIRAVESYNPEETDFADQIKKMVGLFYPRPESVKKMLEEQKILAQEETFDFKYEDKSVYNPEDEGIGAVKGKEEPEPIIDFDAIFIPDNYQRIALIAPQFPYYNVFNVQLLGTSLWQSEKLIETSGDYVQGAIIPTGFFPDSSSEDVKNFLELYMEYFQTEPGIIAANGYDTMKFVKYLLENGSIRYRGDFQERLSQYIISGVTGYISFNKNGETEKEPILLRVSGNRFLAVPRL